MKSEHTGCGVSRSHGNKYRLDPVLFGCHTSIRMNIEHVVNPDTNIPVESEVAT